MVRESAYEAAGVDSWGKNGAIIHPIIMEHNNFYEHGLFPNLTPSFVLRPAWPVTATGGPPDQTVRH